MMSDDDDDSDIIRHLMPTAEVRARLPGTGSPCMGSKGMPV